MKPCESLFHLIHQQDVSAWSVLAMGLAWSIHTVHAMASFLGSNICIKCIKISVLRDWKKLHFFLHGMEVNGVNHKSNSLFKGHASWLAWHVKGIDSASPDLFSPTRWLFFTLKTLTHKESPHQPMMSCAAFLILICRFLSRHCDTVTLKWILTLGSIKWQAWEWPSS